MIPNLCGEWGRVVLGFRPSRRAADMGRDSAAVTDATVAVLGKLKQQDRDALLRILMTTKDSDGAGFTLMRHTVASSDLSADPAYSYDDNSGKADSSLGSFGLEDRGKAMASLLADMRKVQPDLMVLGSVWSPPGWMKNNGALDGKR